MKPNSSNAPRRIAFRVEYDGTSYHGWQSQPDGHPTIQQTLEEAIGQFFDVKCSVQGASRTDAGVHARDQLAAVTIEHPISLSGFVKAVNNRLPRDISIRAPQTVPEDFNPRFGNRGKTYRYRIYHSLVRRPLIDRVTWRIPWALDLESIRSASKWLVGTHDFTSFASTDGGHKTTERTIHRLECLEVDAEEFHIKVTGTAFMKNMVRIIVGTLVEVGRGRVAPDSLSEILDARDRVKAGPTAPARGLSLERIYAHFEADGPPMSPTVLMPE